MSRDRTFEMAVRWVWMREGSSFAEVLVADRSLRHLSGQADRGEAREMAADLLERVPAGVPQMRSRSHRRAPGRPRGRIPRRRQVARNRPRSPGVVLLVSSVVLCLRRPRFTATPMAGREQSREG